MLGSLRPESLTPLAPPAGGVVFGLMGDRVGRKPALLTSIMLMAFATFGVGCLPTYNQIGIAAPTLLLILRMIQVRQGSTVWLVGFVLVVIIIVLNILRKC